MLWSIASLRPLPYVAYARPSHVSPSEQPQGCRAALGGSALGSLSIPSPQFSCPSHTPSVACRSGAPDLGRAAHRRRRPLHGRRPAPLTLGPPAPPTRGPLLCRPRSWVRSGGVSLNVVQHFGIVNCLRCSAARVVVHALPPEKVSAPQRCRSRPRPCAQALSESGGGGWGASPGSTWQRSPSPGGGGEGAGWSGAGSGALGRSGSRPGSRPKARPTAGAGGRRGVGGIRIRWNSQGVGVNTSAGSAEPPSGSANPRRKSRPRGRRSPQGRPGGWRCRGAGGARGRPRSVGRSHQRGPR